MIFTDLFVSLVFYAPGFKNVTNFIYFQNWVYFETLPKETLLVVKIGINMKLQ